MDVIWASASSFDDSPNMAQYSANTSYAFLSSDLAVVLFLRCLEPCFLLHFSGDHFSGDHFLLDDCLTLSGLSIVTPLRQSVLSL